LGAVVNCVLGVFLFQRQFNDLDLILPIGVLSCVGFASVTIFIGEVSKWGAKRNFDGEEALEKYS
jgi:hypothetical protein